MHNEIKPNVSVHWTHRDTVIYKVIIPLSPIVISLLRPAGGKETGTCPLTVVHVAHRSGNVHTSCQTKLYPIFFVLP